MSNIIIDVVRSDSARVDAQLLLGLKGDTGDSAYEYAVAHGYEGTEYEYGELMASYATVAEDAAESASEAAGSASDASDSATDAASSASAAAASATEASGYAGSALASASAASGSATSAEQSAIGAAASASSAASASNSASQSASSATASATSAAASAESASTSAGDAEASAQSASESAEDAASSAQTAEDAKDTILGMTIVTDVEIDGTSVVTDGVADIPVAESNKYGTVKAGLSSVGADSYSAVSLSFKNNGTLKTYTLAQSGVASTTKRGLMSASDKTKLSHIAEGAEVNVQSDWNVSNASSDAYIKNKPTLFSGDYNDLENKPDIPSKTSDLDNDVPFVELSDLSSLLPTDTASGAIASFPDGQSVIPALSVKADIEPIQSGSGTPSPDNVRPISGRTEVVTDVCGVNVWDEEWEVGTISSSTGENATSTTTKFRSKNYISIVEGTAYYLVNGGTYTFGFRFYDANKNYLGSNTAQTSRVINLSTFAPSGTKFIRFVCTTSATYNNDISINYPSTDHDYHAYLGTTHTTSLGRTVYGGTLDVVSGELVVDLMYAQMTYAYLSGLSSDYLGLGGNQTSLGGATVFVRNWNYMIAEPRKSGGIEAYCNAFPISMHDMNIFASQYRIYFGVGSMTSVAEFLQAVQTLEQNGSGLFIAFKLASPQTYQLTPTEIALLKGQNNIWTDSGEVEVTYKADIGKYVDKKITELQALVLEQ